MGTQATLMLNIEGRDLPFAYQVPDSVYVKFAKYQDNLHNPPSLIDQIDAACRIAQHRLMKSIEKWRASTIEELDRHERIEQNKAELRSLFVP